MKAKYKHTNLIVRDWERLAEFYEDVFGCVRVPPERHLSGEWLEKGTAVKGARFSGVHLALPGYEGHAPTLEIYQYSRNEDKPAPAANREGFGHIAFEVEDVAAALDLVRQHGGRPLGEIVCHEVPGDVYAQYNLGLCYRDGDGVPRNRRIAVNWFKKAARQGYEKAAQRLSETDIW